MRQLVADHVDAGGGLREQLAVAVAVAEEQSGPPSCAPAASAECSWAGFRVSTRPPGRHCCFAWQSDALARPQVARCPVRVCIDLRSAGRMQQSRRGDETAGARPLQQRDRGAVAPRFRDRWPSDARPPGPRDRSHCEVHTSRGAAGRGGRAPSAARALPSSHGAPPALAQGECSSSAHSGQPAGTAVMLRSRVVQGCGGLPRRLPELLRVESETDPVRTCALICARVRRAVVVLGTAGPAGRTGRRWPPAPVDGGVRAGISTSIRCGFVLA